MTNDLLYKENATIMRGVAIMFIMLHNFLHYGSFGFSKENEMSFSLERHEAFIEAISAPNANIFGEFFSFLGWIGVPVFIFFTGYGLKKKYPTDSPIDYRKYLRHNYLKLFCLMFPAILFFLCMDVKNGMWDSFLRHIFSLSMLHGLDYPHLKISPGVYWYFSLTFQFYIFYLIFRKYLTQGVLFGLSILSLVILYGLCISDFENSLSIYRHCITGWFPIFALGIYMASPERCSFMFLKPYMRNRLYSMILQFVISVLLIVLVILMGNCCVSWIFIPLLALAFFAFLTKFLLYSEHLSGIFKWIGGISAVIFVCHPIARTIYMSLHLNKLITNVYAGVLIYFLMVLLLAYPYMYVFKRMKSKILK